jgi:iron complex outermembrane receptor protein
MSKPPDYIAFLGTMIILWITISPVLAFNNESGERKSYELEEVTVISTPFESQEVAVPVAIGSVGKDQIQLGQQQLSLQESLVSIPGLFFQNQYNFAQDLRISIRGFGARANFGIRGIKIITDGIPSTMPDGQGNVDDIDLGSARRIEVIRGPSSSLYGSAAGGVINIFTEDGPEIPFIEGRLTFGSHDFQKYQLKGGGQYKQLNYLGNLSHMSYGGYREHSKTENSLVNTKFRYELDPSSSLTVLINAVDSPKARDPGALTEREVKDDRRQAAHRNVLFNAGEEVNQQKIGLVYRRKFGEKHQIALRNFYLWREFDNFLPFDVNSNGQGGSVDLDRFFFGGGADYTYKDQLFGRTNSLMAGFEINAQRDERKRFSNDFGVRGVLTTKQEEDVTGYGIFLQDEFVIMENLRLTLGARYDTLKYKVDDKIGSGSDSRTFDQLSPMVGLLWTVIPEVNVYGNISTSFETPTTTELANPDGPTGFNRDLDPQTAINYEIGVKGLLPARMRYELALFHIKVKDSLVPFELSGSGQTFYESAGDSTHNGLEMSLIVQPVDRLTATLTYTYSDFTFDRFNDVGGNDFDGNKIPGVPDNMFYAGISYFHSTGFNVAWDIIYADNFFADNANDVESGSYTITNLRMGYLKEFKGWEVSFDLGINNMFKERYNNNIRLNASFDRFFEPAPELNIYGGIQVRYNFDY